MNALSLAGTVGLGLFSLWGTVVREISPVEGVLFWLGAAIVAMFFTYRWVESKIPFALSILPSQRR